MVILITFTCLFQNNMSDLNGKRKRASDGEGKRTGAAPKKTRKSLERNSKEKEKQAGVPGEYTIHCYLTIYVFSNHSIMLCVFDINVTFLFIRF